MPHDTTQAEEAPHYDAELDFWRSYIPKDASLRAIGEAHQNRYPERLHAILVEMAGRPSVLEVGPGPKSHLVWGVVSGSIEVTAVDPLADEYAEIMKDAGVDYPIKPIKGFGEDLRAAVGDQLFDAAYSSNAIDHAKDPARCVAEMVDRVRLGGVVYLEGMFAEGTEANWNGLHQHDLVLDEDHIIRRGRDGTESEVTRGLSIEPIRVIATSFARRFGKPSTESTPYQRRPYYVAIYRRT